MKSKPRLSRLTIELLEGRELLSAFALDWDGAEGLRMRDPVEVGPFDVPGFTAGPFGDEAAWIEQTVTARVAGALAAAGLGPDDGRAGVVGIVYIGGSDRAFASFGDFFGLAEPAAGGGGQAFVFSDELLAGAASASEFADRLVEVALHEIGHLIAGPHRATGEDAGVLDAVAHKAGPWPGGNVRDSEPVHQWILTQAWVLYDMQFEGAELGAYLGDWTAYGSAHHETDGVDNDVVEGAFDEDVSDPIGPWGDFWAEISPQNPWGYAAPWLRHYVHGGDGSERYLGLDESWIPGSDESGSYYSALEHALHYWTGFDGFSGVLSYYAAHPARAYYYLGHVGHLVADMTVPAHVHGDPHGGTAGGGDDAYEDWAGSNGRYARYDAGDAAPGWSIELPASLTDLFTLTIDYTEDYDSDDVEGDSPEYASGFRAAGRHRPNAVDRDWNWSSLDNDLESWECEIIANDLVPWAIEQTASLYRLFYAAVDASAPDVALSGGLSTIEAAPSAMPAGFEVTAQAIDAQSGVDRDGYIFGLWRRGGADWEAVPVAGGGARTLVLDGLSDGLYRLNASVGNGAGAVGSSPDYYFAVGSPPASLTARIGTGLPTRLTLLDADGSTVTLTMTDGVAEIGLLGDGLAAGEGRSTLAIAGVAEAGRITLSELGPRAALSISARGGDGLARVWEIAGAGMLRTLSARSADLVGGGIAFGGTIGQIQVHDVLNGAGIVMESAEGAPVIKAGRMGEGARIAFGGAISSLTIADWRGGSLEAASVRTVAAASDRTRSLAGDFVVDMTLSGQGTSGAVLGSLKAKGVLGGNWAVAGDMTALSAAGSESGWSVRSTGEARSLKLSGDAAGRLDAANVGSVVVGGWMDGFEVCARQSILKVSTGAMRNSALLAGIEDGTGQLPLAADELAPGSTIGSLTVRGVRGAAASFVSSRVAASVLARVSLKDVEVSNAGVPFGVAADRMTSLTWNAGNTRERLRGLDEPQERVTVDFVVRVL